MIEEFIEIINQLYWDGYAEQLVKDDPEAFTNQYNEFLNNYNF
jgi:hypothetical protein